MKIALDNAYRSASQWRFPDCTVRFLPGAKASKHAVATAIGDSEVLGLRTALPFPIDDEFLAAVPELRFIQKSGTGVDTFDVDALTQRNILLASNTGFNAIAVAEHTLMLMLLCVHHPRPHIDALRAGTWRESVPVPTPTQLSTKTVGVVGLGGIGAKVAAYALSLGARVVGFARDPSKARIAHPNIELVTLTDLLERADVVTLHVPLTDDTRGMMGASQFEKMQPDSVLINTSRGKIVDERALYQALISGKLAAAGIDVFEEEPTPRENPLLQLHNVYATPHIAGFTVESNELQVQGSLSNIERYVSGIKPERLINQEVWYSR